MSSPYEAHRVTWRHPKPAADPRVDEIRNLVRDIPHLRRDSEHLDRAGDVAAGDGVREELQRAQARLEALQGERQAESSIPRRRRELGL
jgi:hypothetical protein